MKLDRTGWAEHPARGDRDNSFRRMKMLRLKSAAAAGLAALLLGNVDGAGRRPGNLQGGALLRRRLDRHHRDHGRRRRASSTALGYEPEVQVLSVPVTYASLKNKDIDVFLGNWMPTMAADVKPFIDDRSVETISPEPRRRRLRPRRADLCRRRRRQEPRRHRASKPTSSTARSTASSPAMTATASCSA